MGPLETFTTRSTDLTGRKGTINKKTRVKFSTNEFRWKRLNSCRRRQFEGIIPLNEKSNLTDGNVH